MWSASRVHEEGSNGNGGSRAAVRNHREIRRLAARAAALPHRPARGLPHGFGGFIQLHLRLFSVGAVGSRDVITAAGAPDVELMGALGKEVHLTIRGEISGRSHTCRRKQNSTESRG